MTWLSIVATALAILQAVIGWLRERGTIEAAHAVDALKGIQDADAAIDRAQAARAQVRADAARGADAMSDDGFRRPD